MRRGPRRPDWATRPGPRTTFRSPSASSGAEAPDSLGWHGTRD
jgi:hypothetical protein